ncbi:acetyl-CoA synthetase-like protein [Neolentinus lepideus HHB14362 ss-1]|uniref:Acetyl-CoA synthetase-like protein n=1 Tax=Neolentinus lepideus HHB14362 ss-1 TaxID=1314782 RepID=A0A165R388_9AGAM|nr:acetyl-CoA synthetase-like protein [Neolentinus lepideus HHB14362 ss-1]
MASSPSQWTLPPLDGSSTLAELVDFRLQYNSDHTYAVFPSDDPDGEPTHITHLEWCRAIHRVAHVLRPKPDMEKREVVGIIVNCDTLMYSTTIMALIRAGLIPYPMSNRNSSAAVCHMLQKTSCHRLIATSASLNSLISGIKTELLAIDYELEIVELPSLYDAFPHLGHETPRDPFTPYPAIANSKPVGPDDIILYIHSSGSTGFPKSIPYSNKVLLSWYGGCEYQIMLYPKHLRFGALSLPAFHLMGMTFQIFVALIAGISVALFGPKYPAPPIVPGPGNTLEALKRTKVNAVICVPTFLELWSESEGALAFLSKLDIVRFGGGPLSRQIGNKLVSKGVQIQAGYGGTEFGTVTYFISPKGLVDPMEWEYLAFNPEVPVRMVSQGEGKYELQVLHSEGHPLLIHNLPDVPGYATSDLFEKHPTKEGLWKIIGRADDVLILASGEKTVPAPIEGKVLTSSLVSGAMMFGRGHNEVGILIEPRHEHAINPVDEVTLAEFRNLLWPIIEEANEDSPTFSRIFKEMILVTSPDRPMHRTPKGTVIRHATMADYTKEINELYERVESSRGSDVDPPNSWEIADLEEWLMLQAQDINETNQGKKLDPGVDLFAQGFDSLSATFLRNRIIGALRSSADHAAKIAAATVSQNFVFANNTIHYLATGVRNLISPVANVSEHSHAAVMEQLIAKYSADMPATRSSRPLPVKSTVLITGTTGGLGSYMLWMLLEDENVECVYAFNRKSTRATLTERQKVAFEDRGLPANILESLKLILVEGEESSNQLGLESALYEELRTTCTQIIHNAWRLNFNLSVSSFEPNIKGVRNLIDLGLTSPYGVNFRFIFTSSVGISQGWNTEMGKFPEESNLPTDVAVGAGYGESKFVSEQLLVKAAERGIQTLSLRIGQIAGGKPDGSWATTDWVPILVKSSRSLGCLPDAQGVTTWMTSEVVARTVLDTAFAEEHPPSALNVLHPRPVPWTVLREGIRAALVKIVDHGKSKPLPLVPFKQWITLLENKAVGATESDMKATISMQPAIKLLPRFQNMAKADEASHASGETDTEAWGMPRFATQKAQAVSPTLRDAPQLDVEDAERWIVYWHRKGFFE